MKSSVTLPPILVVQKRNDKYRNKLPKVIITENDQWYCHCCMARNEKDIQKCRVCGRDKKYVVEMYLPLHGTTSEALRLSQYDSIIKEENMEDIHNTDSLHWTPLHSCASTGNVALVDKLVSSGAVVQAVTDHGMTPLHLAAYSGSVDTIITLLKNKADVNAFTNYEKMTPLHISAQEGWKEAVQLLIAAGAVVDAQNILERTPLHFCATSGRIDIAIELIRNGADVQLTDIHGWNVRQIAEFHKFQPFLEMLDEIAMIGINDDPVIPMWRSSIWTDVVRMKADRKKELTQEKQRWEATVTECNKARTKIEELMHEHITYKEQFTKAFQPPELRLSDAKDLQELSSCLYDVSGKKLTRNRKQKAPLQTSKERIDAIMTGFDSKSMGSRLQLSGYTKGQGVTSSKGL